MQDNIFTKYRNIWQSKPVLRKIYHQLYEMVVMATNPGETLEIGGGSGNLKSYLKEVISTDIVPSPWLDAIADAQALPFKNESFSNIIGVDVLHHIEAPLNFFNEAFRVLNLGGRIILVEPAITKMSAPFYNYFHPEPVDMGVNLFQPVEINPRREPFDANQAIPTLLFRDNYSKFSALFPQQRLIRLEWLSLIAYPLSGGFRSWSLIPECLVDHVLRFEKSLPNFVKKLMGFRMLIVLEKVT